MTILESTILQMDAVLLEREKVKDKTATVELYGDGSCIPNPGPSGWGIYAEDSLGNVFNGWGGLSLHSSNNRGELAAYLFILKLVKRMGWTSAIAHLDSRYVIDGAMKTLKVWKGNDWRRRDGNVISNKDLWMLIDEAQLALKASHQTVTCQWVKAHTGIHGNEMADKNADKGRLSIKRGEGACFLHGDIDIPVEVKQKVKKTKGSKVPPCNRLVAGKRLYFTTNSIRQTPDDYYIYTTNSFEDKTEWHGRLCGQLASDNLHGVILTKEPIAPLETLIEYQNVITPDDFVQPVIGILDRLVKPANWNQLTLEGYSQLTHNRLNIQTLDGEPLSLYVRPPRRAYDTMDILNVMLDRLDNYRFNNTLKGVEYQDITDILYKKVGKDWKVHTDKGKALNYFTVPGKKKKESIVLTIGIDLLPRNNLIGLGKQAETLKVTLMKFNMSKKGFRYSVIFETETDYGIYMTSNANVRTL